MKAAKVAEVRRHREILANNTRGVTNPTGAFNGGRSTTRGSASEIITRKSEGTGRAIVMRKEGEENHNKVRVKEKDSEGVGGSKIPILEDLTLNKRVEREGNLERPQQEGGHKENCTERGEFLVEKSVASGGKTKNKKWKRLAREKGDQSEDLGEMMCEKELLGLKRDANLVPLTSTEVSGKRAKGVTIESDIMMAITAETAEQSRRAQ